MKYLRKFNESSNEYYQKAEYNEWIDAIYSKSVEFEQKYVDEIQKRLKTEYYRINQHSNFIEIFYDRWSNYEIGQAQDEWFYVRKEVQDYNDLYNQSYVYYKCDQFEGLLKFLKNYGLIN